MYGLEGEGNEAAGVHIVEHNWELLDRYGTVSHFHPVRVFHAMKVVLTSR